MAKFTNTHCHTDQHNSDGLIPDRSRRSTTMVMTLPKVPKTKMRVVLTPAEPAPVHAVLHEGHDLKDGLLTHGGNHSCGEGGGGGADVGGEKVSCVHLAAVTPF